MATTPKKAPPKSVRIAPTVTDPSMRNPRGPAEMLLNDELGDTVDDHDAIFAGSAKTKEEQDATVEKTDSSSNSTILIIVFALIVIALVGLIVWMLMRQSNNAKDEEEMRRVIQPHPHPRNNMPQMRQPVRDEETERNMQAMYQQQLQMQRQMADLNQELQPKQESRQETRPEPRQEPRQENKQEPKSFVEMVTDKDTKERQKANKNKGDTQGFSIDNPHPSIIRPGKPASDDVDDVIAQTKAVLSSSQNHAKKSLEASKDMSDLDKSLLAKLENNEDSDESDDEEES